MATGQALRQADRSERQAQPLPRVLDLNLYVQAREREISALCHAIQRSGGAWGAAALPRHLRRRATSHKPHTTRRRPNSKRQRHEGGDSGGAEASATATASTREPPRCRAHRRRPGQLRQAADQSAAQVDPCTPLGDPAGTSWAGEWRLKAEMEAQPAVPVPHGGVAAVERQLETHAWHAKRFKMVSTWSHRLPLVAVGKGHGRGSVVKRLRTGAVVHDASYVCTIMLKGPTAQISELLRTVTGLDGIGADTGQHGKEQHLVLHSPAEAGAHGAVSPVAVIRLRASPAAEAEETALLTVHPSAAAAVYSVLVKSSCGGQVSCKSLTGQVRRIELRGSKSSEALTRALGLTSSGDAASEASATSSVAAAISRTGDAEGHVLSTALSDPRLCKEAASLSLDQAGSEEELTVWLHEGGVRAPASEAIISRHRQRQHRQEVHLSVGDECLRATAAVKSSPFRCPAIMIRRSPHGPYAVSGWTLLLPAGWVRPFWQALVMAGCQALGIREWQWCAQDMGLPVFPQDFPDTPAGCSHVDHPHPRKIVLATHLPDYPVGRVLRTADELRRAREGNGKGGPVAEHVRVFIRPDGKGRLKRGARLFHQSHFGQQPASVSTDSAGLKAPGPCVGLVTSAGAGGVGAEPYGASAVCLLCAVPNRESEASRGEASGAKIAYLNPGSSALRQGRLEVCLDAKEDDCTAA